MKFNLFYESIQNSKNCDFEIKLNGLTNHSSTKNYIKEYLRNLYICPKLDKKAGKMTLVSNIFYLSHEEIVSSDAFFKLKHGNIYTKAIDVNTKKKCDNKKNVTYFDIIGGSQRYKNIKGTIKQVVLNKKITQLTFNIIESKH
jgi:hypothetical protein